MNQSKQNNIDEKLKQLLIDNTKSSFDPDFQEKIISKLVKDTNTRNSFENLLEQLLIQFRGFAFAVVIVLLIMITYNVFDEGEFTLASVLDIPQVSIHQAVDPINNLEWSD